MRKTMVVVGGTGAQGGSVVKALSSNPNYLIRVITRDTTSVHAKALEAANCELHQVNLNQPEGLKAAFHDAYGIFAVTNFWDRETRLNEYEQGKAMVRAAREAGIQHFIWSTLPDYEALSNGKYNVPHFTSKARVDLDVKKAGFTYTTFVEAPFYFQNFHTIFAPQQNENGEQLWRLPLDPHQCSFHSADIGELGLIVRAALDNPQLAGNENYLPLSAGIYNWQQLIDILNDQGHRICFEQIPAEGYDKKFPSAREFRQMMEFWQEFDYFGPDSPAKLALVKKLIPKGFTSFEQWSLKNMPAKC